MFRFTLSGRVVRKLVYIGHTILVIEADRANLSLVSCIVRDERLKETVDYAIRTDGAVCVDGSIEWFHQIAPNASCCYFYGGPAAVMAYFVFDDLSGGWIAAELGRQGLCLLGAGGAGGLAFGRLAEGEAE